ncbi:D-alanyl-D-alanine carboxypeptidase/D-alanyl-D-alanine-endopeptidase [uncultured Fusobacterium sp.]|uniref:D-alanyl-D-alanine carboxypeptidase/D-alanyl-D-alanine endopeptidase n=1 Tax=uncultured Fusobacterium sp. TaxID=159267 RepID=UPI0025FDFC02|nr:D-alanyl-D-alanine carboxypeptidase/D-alanyl-D-alanine-endopeptidase [uncultured Fusobacterium sp.]
MIKKVLISTITAAFILNGCSNISTVPTISKEDKQPKAVKEFVQADILEYGNFSFYAIDLKSGESIANYKGKVPLIPASVMKIVTSATAYEVLGEDFKLETKLLYQGKISDKGVLNGDLFIQGGGDPTLGSNGIAKKQDEFLKEWILAVKKAGIKEVKGDIVVLDDLFGYEGISGKWLWEDMGTDYAPITNGISIFDNLYKIYLKSDNEKVAIEKIVPNVKGITFDNKVKVSEAGKKDIYVRGIPFDNNRILRGVMPKNTNIIVNSDIPDPGMFLGEYLKENLIKDGVKVSGKVVTSRISNKQLKNGETLAVTQSAPLSEILRVLLTRSDNHYAEHIFEILKLKDVDIIEFWKNKGINIDSLVMYDGSGLSCADRLSTKFLTEVLVYMDKANKGFTDLLPIAGKEGTVAKFLVETPLSGNAKIKSGSMSGVQSYAGYLDKDSKKIAFAIVVNHWNGTRQQLRAEMEKLLNGMIK